jgi:hypothetical protein
LFQHANRGVRYLAAAEALAWGSSDALEIVEGLISPRGTHSLSAEITLQQYRSGRMVFDW